MKIWMVALVLVLGVASAIGQQAPLEIVVPVQSSFSFVAYGDTRFTDPTNTRAANPFMRQEIVRKIAETEPSFVSIGGDISYNGNDAADWAQYDKETAVWREKKIAVFPALGNHDLHGEVKTALANYFLRYPDLHNSRYYSVRAGNTLMLVLDSSLDELAGPQGDWVKSKLSSVADDTDFVFVVLHHPPYTSSSDAKKFGGGHSSRTTEQALGEYLEDRQKTMHARVVVISGHVHNYERKQHGGVVYFVTGGGGADAYPIERRPDDLFQSDQINFHFLSLDVDPGKLTAVMHRVEMKEGRAVWTEPDTMTVSTQPKSRVTASVGK